MDVLGFSVRNHQFTLVVFAMLAALGLASFLTIPRSEDPEFPISTFSVVAVYPGAAPGDMEKLVADPLEKALKELDDLKSIKTTIEDGVSVMLVDFDAATDAGDKHQEVMRQIQSVDQDLPEGLTALEVTPFNTSNVNIVQVALISESASAAELRERAEELQDALTEVEGVRRAEIHGSPERQVRVDLDVAKLAHLRLPMERVLGALQAGNVNIPGGSVDIGAAKFNVRTGSDYASVEEIANTTVQASGQTLLRLKDIARVELTDARPVHIARYNGRRAVFVTATKQEGANLAVVRRRLEAPLESFRAGLPSDMVAILGFDQYENVKKRLGSLYRDFALANLLVLLTLLPLGLRAALIVMVSVPLSLGIGVACLHYFGFTLNQLSIVGFVVALGLLVDDSIVVIENITRFLRRGMAPGQAAIQATSQIGKAVLGCTATLLLAFLPMLFLPGGSGKFIKSFPVAVFFTILASLLVSLTIVPFLAARFLRSEREGHENRFLKGMNRLVEGLYRPLLTWTLKHKGPTLALSSLLFFASLGLVPLMGFSLFPKSGTPQFLIVAKTPDGSSLAATDSALRFVEAVLATSPQVDAYMANAGRGNPMIYYNVIPQTQKANVGEVFVQIREYSSGPTERFLDSLRVLLSAYPGADIEVRQFENGPVTDAPIAIRIVGPDLDTLKALAANLERTMRSTPGTRSVDNPLASWKTDLEVSIDRDKVGHLSVPPMAVARAVRLAFGDLPAGTYRDQGGKEHKIVAGLGAEPEPDLAAFSLLRVTSWTGAQVPLSEVARVGFATSPPVIRHYNMRRAIIVTSQVESGYNTGKVTASVLEKLEDSPLPRGYGYVLGGEIESQKESFGGMGTAIIISVFGVLAVLLLEFRTFKSTLIVASAIPLGTIGGLVLLFLGGHSLSFTAACGFVALIGMEVKNSILLVEFTNQLRASGMALNEAVLQAGETRFTPILMTTMTALGGLIPISLSGSPLYSPLALVLIGGLLSSTFLTRLVTPVVYCLLAPESRKVTTK